jgi:predicted phage replisome organizer
MGNQKFYWLKLKRDFFKRHDIRIIEEMPNGKDYVLFYLKLLLESIDHDGELRFSETIPYNEQMLSVITNTNIDLVRSAMRVFTQLKMVEVLDDETIYMTEVQKMTGSETKNAVRVREHRLRLESSTGQQSGNTPKPEPKTNAERQRMYRAKKACEDQQHIPYIEAHMNNKRYGGNYYTVMQRDAFKCALCNAVTPLCVHHIDGYNEDHPENNDENRMVVLCRPCHSLVHAGKPLPQELLARIGYDRNVTQPCNTVTKNCNTEIEKEKEIEIDTELETERDKSTGAAAPPPTQPKPKPSKPERRNYGEYGWVLLTQEQHARLLADLGAEELSRCITYIDESAQLNGNKNKWRDWNLVIRRCSREGWGRNIRQSTPAKPDTLGILNRMMEESK